ncbi:MAG: CDGSH iron-sulfur domain-containing protein [Cyanobacteria bacterium P01_E01_bin.35]
MSDVKIEVKDNGLLLVQGGIELVDADDKAFDTDKPAIALFRCGVTGNSPFCDSPHRKIGFESAPKASWLNLIVWTRVDLV